MRDDVIRTRYAANEPEADYLCEVTRRLEPLFPGGLTDVSLGMALFYALQMNSIAFDDGFVINDLRDEGRTIGVHEAAVVVAALDAAERPAEWWDDQRFAKAAADDDKLIYRQLVERFKELAGVTRVD